MALLAGAVLPKLSSTHAKMSGLCHWSCPQTLASATPLGESARSISHVTVSADASLNDCGNAPGWYYFPGTRLAIQDVDGVLPVSRCGAERGMMHMLFQSGLPALGAAKASVTICMAACQIAASLRLWKAFTQLKLRLLGSQRLNVRCSNRRRKRIRQRRLPKNRNCVDDVH